MRKSPNPKENQAARLMYPIPRPNPGNTSSSVGTHQKRNQNCPYYCTVPSTQRQVTRRKGGCAQNQDHQALGARSGNWQRGKPWLPRSASPWPRGFLGERLAPPPNFLNLLTTFYTLKCFVYYYCTNRVSVLEGLMNSGLIIGWFGKW